MSDCRRAIGAWLLIAGLLISQETWANPTWTWERPARPDFRVGNQIIETKSIPFVDSVWLDEYIDRVYFGNGEFNRTNHLRKLIGEELGDPHSTKGVAASLQTAFILLVGTGMANFYHELQQNSVSHKSITDPLVAKKVLWSTWYGTVENKELFFSLFGDRLAHYTFEPAFEFLSSAMGSQVGRGILGQLFMGGITSGIVFFFWELFHRLAIHTSRLLPENDYKRAQNFGSLVAGAMFTTCHSREPDSFVCTEKLDPKAAFELKENRRVLGEIIQIAARILLNDPTLRSRLFYDCWRLQLAKGDFFILLAALVGAGVVGNAILPGFGMAFSIIGFGIATITPTSFKDWLTFNSQYVSNEMRKDIRLPGFMDSVGQFNLEGPEGAYVNAVSKINDQFIEMIRPYAESIHSTTAGLCSQNTICLLADVNSLVSDQLGKTPEERSQDYDDWANDHKAKLTNLLDIISQKRSKLMTAYFQILSSATHNKAEAEYFVLTAKNTLSLLDAIDNGTLPSNSSARSYLSYASGGMTNVRGLMEQEIRQALGYDHFNALTESAKRWLHRQWLNLCIWYQSDRVIPMYNRWIAYATKNIKENYPPFEQELLAMLANPQLKDPGLAGLVLQDELQNVRTLNIRANQIVSGFTGDMSYFVNHPEYKSMGYQAFKKASYETAKIAVSDIYEVGFYEREIVAQAREDIISPQPETNIVGGLFIPQSVGEAIISNLAVDR